MTRPNSSSWPSYSLTLPDEESRSGHVAGATESPVPIFERNGVAFSRDRGDALILTAFRLMEPVNCFILTTLMEEQIRAAARKHLPGGVRRPLGALAGKFKSAVVQPLQGLMFDLQGGRFNADGCTFAIPKDITTRAYRA